MKKQAVTVAALAFFAFAAPASAEVLGKEGGFTYVKKTKTLPGGGSGDDAEAVAKCPSDQVHAGGGATVTGDARGTTLSTVGLGNDRSWFASAWHTGINSKDKKLTAWVTCTSKVSTMSANTEVVSVGSGPASGSTAVACDSGVVTGGGTRLIGSNDDWWLNSTYPVDMTDPDPSTNDGWRAYAQHLDGTLSSTMLVDVVCLTGKEPLYRSTSRETSKELVTLKTSCPNDRAVTGGGAFASGAADEAYVVSTAPFDSKDDKDKVPDDGWKAKIQNNTSGELQFGSSAVCR